jgi:hypothetical protein
MVIEKNKCVFVHIPKTAGSSIEKILNPEIESVSQESDENLFVGWSECHGLWMQHATMNELNRLYKHDLTTYFKFGFVRNPWDRAVSDYLWLQRDTPDEFKELFSSATLLDYLTESGPFSTIFNNKGQKEYRGDHITPQYDFLFDKNGNQLVNFIGKTEDFNNDMKYVLGKIGMQTVSFPHEKESDRGHYTEYYNDETIELVAKKYEIDIKTFKYNYG